MRYIHRYTVLVLLALMIVINVPVFAAVDGQTFAINIGDTVSPNVPGTGAGNIGVATEVDRYTFTAPANQRLLVTWTDSLIDTLKFRLLNPNGEEVVQFQLQNASQRFIQFNNVAGTYTIEIFDNCCEVPESSTGDYSFTLVDLTPVVYPITVGTTVATDSPSAGAGRLTYTDEIDVYEFEVGANTPILLEGGDTLIDSLNGLLLNPNGEEVGEYRLEAGDDYSILLTLAGKYRLEVRDTCCTVPFDETGIYSFSINYDIPDNLLTNGDFEADLTGWIPSGAGRVQIKNKFGKAQSGSKFVSMNRGKARLTQAVTPAYVLSGGTLNLSLYYRVKRGGVGKTSLIVTYTDSTRIKFKPNLKSTAGFPGWQQVNQSYPLTGTVQSFEVVIKNSIAGSVFVDTAALSYTP